MTATIETGTETERGAGMADGMGGIETETVKGTGDRTMTDVKVLTRAFLLLLVQRGARHLMLLRPR